jgi:hypothetical protein
VSEFRITITHNAAEVAEALRRAPRAVLGELDRAMRTGAVAIARDARERAPKANSELVNAIAPERISLLEHHVRAAKNYASHQERGTGPGGRPSLTTMIQWIRRKGLSARAGMSERSLAFLIRRSIARKGVPAKPFMKPALEAQRSRLDGLFRAAVARGLQQVAPGRGL